MPRFTKPALLALAVVFTAAPARADWFHAAWDSVKRDVMRNNSWPEPFIFPDRAAASAPFAIMINNGWRKQNTLSDHHFEEGSQVTESGRLKIKWIVTQAPEDRRTIFVFHGVTAEETQKRLDAVQQAAQKFVPQGDLPAVVSTDREDEGGRADYANKVDKMFSESMKPPILPKSSSGDSSGSSSGN